MVRVVFCRTCECELTDDNVDGTCPQCVEQARFANGDTDSPARSERATCLLDAEPFDPRCPAWQRTCGDYELLAMIAQGGMGLVYKARQISLNRIVALKVIRAGQLASSEDVQRFHIEAKAAAYLDHPRIIPIYEVGEWGGIHYFSMKLVEGGNLAEHMARYVNDPRAGARLIAAIGRGIHYAHQRGILHRDLKPANILIDQDGRPHVADFGVAKHVEGPPIDGGPERGVERIGATLSGGIVGTPSYMAPEQAAGARDGLTMAVDVYSLGAILYEMLTGTPPFKGASQMATLKQVIEQTPRQPRERNPRADKALSAIALKCLARDPQERYASADALVDDVERWLAGQPISALPRDAVVRTGLWARRQPLTAALAAALIIMATMSFLGIRFQASQTQRAFLAVEHHAAEALRSRVRAELTHEKVTATAYGDCLELAQRFLAAGKVERAYEFLLAAAPEFRSWEWHLLHRACVQPGFDSRRIAETEHVLTGLGVDPTGRWLLWRAQDGSVVLWNVQAQRPERQLKGNFRQAVFGSADVVVALDTQGNVANWQVADGRCLRQESSTFTALARLPGQGTLLGSPAGKVHVVDETTGAMKANLGAGQSAVRQLVPSDDGQWLLTQCDGECPKLWETTAWKERVTLADCPCGATILAVSADSERAVINLPDRTTRIWNLATGAKGPILAGHVDAVATATFVDNGRRIVTGCLDHVLKVWDAATGQELLTLHGHQGPITSLAATRAGVLFSTGRDGNLHVWDGQPTVP